ncbi:MAG: pyrroline-5-carboxylate reductase [Spirochaetales bacterium]|nr:MAG: pyrroline-5-carboxylate reductase [Spirochaetales bacterium]
MSLAGHTIGIIGAGNMGGAIAAGLARAPGGVPVRCFDTDTARAEALVRGFGVEPAASIGEMAGTCDIIILAVKPDALQAVLKDLKGIPSGKLIISVVAGASTELIEKTLPPAQKVIRVMPNTPALVGEGMTVLSAGAHADADSMALAVELFSNIGKTMVLPERLMNAVTGLSGSGPAFAFTMIQAMADGGVKSGIPRERALFLAAQTVLGAARMVLETGDDPAVLRGRVASPGGTTIEGLHVMERAGFSGIVMDAVEAAALKSARLGEKS